MQDLTDFMREFLDYYFAQVHTSLPGVVVEYDASKRRATVQPSLKRRAGNKEYINFPLLIDVPVQFQGSKQWTIHFPLEEGDEVAVFFSERALEVWKDMGRDGIEDPDPRRYDLCDAYCAPGLQPQEFIAATEPGLQIIHKDKFDGELISQVLMTDDKIEMIYKKKALVTMEDDHVTGKTEKCSVEMIADVVTAKNSQLTMKLNAAKASLKNGGKSLYTIFHTFFQTLQTTQPTTLGSPAAHNWNPAIAQAIGTADTDISALLEA
ncbi:MAG: hypothetical protein LBL45_02850 [Treponema sp.]|jgi:hypothetical protein|nr:hypothetical protein [Treponema sp.]